MRILLYDVETANAKNMGSICAVGWMLLENDSVTDYGYSLINPNCQFSKYNTKVHGITEADVTDAPCFCEYWKNTLQSLTTSSLVVAHNAGFDLSATEQALYNAGITDRGIDYFDTLAMFRNLIRTDSYKLTDLASAFGYVYAQHNALEDVKALYYVLSASRKLLGFEDIPSMMLRSHVASENTLGNNYLPHEVAKATFQYDNSSRCREDVEIQDHLFSGLRFCFTGEISGFERSDLERIIKQHDGRMTGSVSGKTNYLVVGTYEELGDTYVSGKQKAALELIENGGSIKIISPAEFFALLKPHND